MFGLIKDFDSVCGILDLAEVLNVLVLDSNNNNLANPNMLANEVYRALVLFVLFVALIRYILILNLLIVDSISFGHN